MGDGGDGKVSAIGKPQGKTGARRLSAKLRSFIEEADVMLPWCVTTIFSTILLTAGPKR